MLAIVLCGGSGTRLWPVSRQAMPKPFMRIGGGVLLTLIEVQCGDYVREEDIARFDDMYGRVVPPGAAAA